MADDKGGGGGERAKWGSHVEFVLTMVGYAVGLGNVWRFPYLCFRNGGGAFLIPYFVSLVVMGIPLFYLELSFGQFASLGPVKIWVINPAMKGLGYAMVITSGMIALYYNVIIAVCVYFFFASMTSDLPWSTCEDTSWASCYCRDSTMNRSDLDPWNNTRPDCVDMFANGSFDPNKTTTPSEDYFHNRVLHQTEDLATPGSLSWELTLCLLLTWIIVFLVLTKGIKTLGKARELALCLLLTWLIVFIVLTKGIKTIGKVVYVTAIFPYILLTVLLVRGVTLEGHSEGIDYYLTPNVTKLQEAKVWSDAAVQIFYSLSACQGGLVAMASYNSFHNNGLRDTFLIPIVNCLTSFYAGFVIFSSLGFMAHIKGVPVSEVAAGGPELAFIVYPETIAQMPVAPLWSILFFIMMMMLGFSSSFSIVETVLTGLIDEVPFFKKTKWHTIGFRGAACLSGFLLGIPMVTGTGFHLLELVDNATGGFPLLFIGFFEIVAVIYIYGAGKFMKDIELMLGRSIFTKASWFYFLPTWCFITPICLMANIVFKCIQYESKHSKEPEIFPVWADAIWWLIVAFPILAIPTWYLGYYWLYGGVKVWIDVNSPKQRWGPALTEHREGTKYDNDGGSHLAMHSGINDGKDNLAYIQLEEDTEGKGTDLNANGETFTDGKTAL